MLDRLASSSAFAATVLAATALNKLSVTHDETGAVVKGNVSLLARLAKSRRAHEAALIVRGKGRREKLRSPVAKFTALIDDARRRRGGGRRQWRRTRRRGSWRGSCRGRGGGGRVGGDSSFSSVRATEVAPSRHG
jgi:hypothetical protein